MADIHIPQTSSWVTWPGGKRGTVHITAALPIHRPSAFYTRPTKTLRQLRRELKQGTANGSGGYVPIELKFPRRSFDLMMKAAVLFQEAYTAKERTDQEQDAIHEALVVIRAHLPKHMRAVIGSAPQELLSGWASSIAETLHYFGLHVAGEQSRQIMTERWSLLPDPKDSGYRQGRQTLESAFCGVSFRLVLRRPGLRSLGALCSTPEGKRALTWEVQWHLLPYILMDWGVKGLPRGRHRVQAQFLQYTAAVAIMMARRLIAKVAGGDEALRKELAKIMKSNIGSSSERLQRHFALELADRTLRPAWSHHKISSPLDLDPTKAYKHLCPPQLRTDLQAMLNRLSPLQHETFVTAWFRRLLGPEGQTAKNFDLL